MRQLAVILALLIAAPTGARAGFFYFANPKRPATSVWPFGTDGAANLTSSCSGSGISGTWPNCTIASGVVKDYSSLTIPSGVTLSVTGSGWIRIGVSGNATIGGTLKAVTNGDVPAGQTYSSNKVDNAGGNTGAAISYTFATKTGGGGGIGGDMVLLGGAQNSGNGGYGGAGTCGTGAPSDQVNANSTTGGKGQSSFFGSGGAGASVYGNTGGAAGAAGGGGGGSRGYGGGGIWLKVAGTLSGSGVFDAHGSNGGNGGSATATFDGCDDGMGGTYSTYGGGGGGGAGGNGGAVLVETHVNSFAGTSSVAGGSGGPAGVSVTAPNNGSPGQAGAAGTFSLTTF